VQRVDVDALQLGEPATVKFRPLSSESCDSLTKFRAVDGAGRAAMEEDRAGVERCPARILSVRDIEHDPVCVELRVELARGRVGETGDGEARVDVPIPSAEPTTGPATLAL
jgi:hypothetical protein